MGIPNTRPPNKRKTVAQRCHKRMQLTLGECFIEQYFSFNKLALFLWRRPPEKSQLIYWFLPLMGSCEDTILSKRCQDSTQFRQKSLPSFTKRVFSLVSLLRVSNSPSFSKGHFFHMFDRAIWARHFASAMWVLTKIPWTPSPLALSKLAWTVKRWFQEAPLCTQTPATVTNAFAHQDSWFWKGGRLGECTKDLYIMSPFKSSICCDLIVLYVLYYVVALDSSISLVLHSSIRYCVGSGS